jgi:hypothetical protein
VVTSTLLSISTVGISILSHLTHLVPDSWHMKCPYRLKQSWKRCPLRNVPLYLGLRWRKSPSWAAKLVIFRFSSCLVKTSWLLDLRKSRGSSTKFSHHLLTAYSKDISLEYIMVYRNSHFKIKLLWATHIYVLL